MVIMHSAVSESVQEELSTKPKFVHLKDHRSLYDNLVLVHLWNCIEVDIYHTVIYE